MNDGALDGMQTFDGELLRLINEGVMDAESALTYATNPTNLRLRLGFDDHGNDASAAPAEQAPAATPETVEPVMDSDLENLIER